MQTTEQTHNLYEQAIWDKGYQNAEFSNPPANDQVATWLGAWAKKYFDNHHQGECLEVGCFPGGYLSVMGKLGYKLNGVDLAPRIDTDMVSWLNEQKFQMGDFVRSDFFKFNPTKKFDVVYSLGFIEHFTNWEEVLMKHCELVKKDGYLLIATPNFKGGFQKALHQFLDSDNLSRHYLPSMDPDLWKVALEKNGFKVLNMGYFDTYEFWVGEQKRNIIQRVVCLGLRVLQPVLKVILPKNSPVFAPYCGIVAVKK